MPFKPGESGNPTGRPKGIIDKRTELSRLLQPHARGLVTKAVDLALAGDIQALRLCLERLIPRARDETITLITDEDLTKESALLSVGSTVLQAVMKGELTPEQGKAFVAILEAQRKAIETAELAARVQEIETILKQRKAL